MSDEAKQELTDADACPDCEPMSDEAKEELTERQKKILELNKANGEMIGRIEKWGFNLDGIGESRIEVFIENLIEWGVITSDQMEQFNLEWCEDLNSRLMKMETQARAAAVRLRQHEAEQRRAQHDQIVTPQPPALIVPGHSGRKNGNGRRGR